MTFDVIDFGLPVAYCLLFAIYVVIAIRRVQRGNGLGKSLAIVTIAGTVLTAAAFVVPGLPNIADRIRERMFLAELRRGANEDEIVRSLTSMHAKWHGGITVEPGEAYGAFELATCRRNCEGGLQAAFDYMTELCAYNGNVVTVRFDRRGRVTSWRQEIHVDGC